MVAQLRSKPGADAIGVTIGDFATTTVDGVFALAFLVFNTINNLTTQEQQVACFQNVARHLQPGGCFVIEVGVPSSGGSRPASGSAPSRSATRIRHRRVRRREPGPCLAPLPCGRRSLREALDPFRYVWPSARPDGATRKHDPPRTLEQLAARPVHQREHQARLRVAEDMTEQAGSRALHHVAATRFIAAPNEGPEEAAAAPVIKFSIVDLPLPEGPLIATISPGRDRRVDPPSQRACGWSSSSRPRRPPAGGDSSPGRCGRGRPSRASLLCCPYR